MISAILINFKCSESIHEIYSKLGLLYDHISEILVVDNSGCYVVIGREKVISPAANVGFGRAINLAVEHSSKNTTHFLVLNSDIIVKTHELKRYVQHLISEKPCLSTPKVLQADGSISRALLREKFSAKVEFQEMLGLPKKSDALRQCESGHKAQGFSGCAFAISRSALEKVGGFPQEIFMYGEDYYVCEKLKRLNIRVDYYPDCVVNHASGGTQRSLLMRINRLWISANGKAKAIQLLSNGTELSRAFSIASFIFLGLISPLVRGFRNNVYG